MDKKTTLATLAFCLTTTQAHGSTASSDVAAHDADLRTLQILEEESIPYEEFQIAVKPGSGNYSRHSISSGNYSRHSISSSNYSRHSISSGNYSRHSISSSNYSRHSISGAPYSLEETGLVIPEPVNALDPFKPTN